MLFHQNKRKKIFWAIHNAGLINQLMSLEIGAGVAFMEKMPITFYDYDVHSLGPIFSAAFLSKVPEKRKILRTSIKPNLFDIIDIPNDINWNNINKPQLGDVVFSENNIRFYYVCQPGANESEFAEDRPRLIVNKSSNTCFRVANLAFYSRFFFNRPKELDVFFSKLKFRQQYFDFAEKIAKSIGDFSAIHYRLTDHAKNYDATPENRLKYFKQLQLKGLPIVVSSCDADLIKSEMKESHILIDDYIFDNFLQEFLQLEFHDEVIFALICALVLSHSQYFTGTPGSTYSAYIHRLRCNNNKSECFFNMPVKKPNEPFEQTGPFSWNGFRCATAIKNWWREWPECKLNLG